MLTGTVLRTLKVRMDSDVRAFYSRECLVCNEKWEMVSDGSGDLLVSLNIMDAQVETHLLKHVQEEMEKHRAES